VISKLRVYCTKCTLNTGVNTNFEITQCTINVKVFGSQGDPLFLHWIFPGAERGNQIAPFLENPMPQ
jgi:hypothetical protein